LLIWLRFDTSGLPDIEALQQYLQPNTYPIADPCVGTITAVLPYEGIGANMRAALGAAEAPEDSPDALTATFRSFRRSTGTYRRALSMLIARTLICTPSKPLNHSMSGLRTAIQLERRYSKRELLTILANRSIFAAGVVGVEAASLHFFRMHASELSIDEAALLAGLIKSPGRYSPITHPDRAIARRNEVIDAMLRNGTISESGAMSAKAAPLRLAIESSGRIR
jgi:membrane carboxypeptidase/penicillin-binding protein